MPVQRAQRRYLGYVIATALAFGGSATPALAKPEDKNAKAAKPADTKSAPAKPAAATPASAPAKQAAKPKPSKPAAKAASKSRGEVSEGAAAARTSADGGRVGRADGARQGDAVAGRDPAHDRLLANHAGCCRHVESSRRPTRPSTPRRRAALRFRSRRLPPLKAAQRLPPMSRSQSRRSIWFAAARPPTPARSSRRSPIRSRASSSNGRSCAAMKTTRASTASLPSSPITRAGRTPRCCAGEPKARCGTRGAPPTRCAISSPHQSR